MTKLIYKTYDTKAPMEIAYERITGSLLSVGLVMEDVTGSITTFKYPGLFFSSRRPATFISNLSMEISREFGRTRIRFGVNLKKIKTLTAAFVVSTFFILPPLLNYLKTDRIDFSPMSGFGIAIGFLIYYHVRWRVFRLLKNQVINSGDKK